MTIQPVHSHSLPHLTTLQPDDSLLVYLKRLWLGLVARWGPTHTQLPRFCVHQVFHIRPSVYERSPSVFHSRVEPLRPL